MLCVLSALLVAVGLLMLYQPSQGGDSAILSENYEAVLQEDGIVGRCDGASNDYSRVNVPSIAIWYVPLVAHSNVPPQKWLL